jgi:hypothetical protein
MKRIDTKKFCGFAADSYESCGFGHSYELDACIPKILYWIRIIREIRS